MKYLLVLLLSCISFLVNAKSDTYYNFVSSWIEGGYNLVQRYDGQTEDSKNYLRNVCGVMSLLAVHNYYTYLDTEQPDSFTSSKLSVKNAIYRLFQGSEGYSLGFNPESRYQKLDEMVNLVEIRWGWYTRVRSTDVSAYKSLSASYEQLINDISIGRPSIVLMKGYSSFEPKAIDGTQSGVDHFIVIIDANNSNVVYFDPWDGSIKTKSSEIFKKSWVYTYINFIAKPYGFFI